ncbi:MAG: flagellar assembly protein FliW [Opitutae bacterium]|nr:flagellar assembly protein FliW [Opitutae bacterium]MBT4667655.1 flagellar assembly protein FliW [Opitutae bacterium]MBT5910549.1 flagellar assembly protein FliW [Opitutae bacterium]MBT7742244.1 flagellar assembly protein FliW [Opitutae bacterium]MBT7922839.1 flagellar assembly protein FliW [Opitutae bacterium]
MKLNLQDDLPNSSDAESATRNEVSLPQGLFGFPDIRSMELVFDKEELPFMWLREQVQDGLAFVVLEPGGIVQNYAVEISDADIQILGISGSEDTMILNIVTISSEHPGKISLNLVGPIIVNRTTLVAKQCIINNHEEFSARHMIDVGDTEA